MSRLDPRVAGGLLRTIPALPVPDVPAAVVFTATVRLRRTPRDRGLCCLGAGRRRAASLGRHRRRLRSREDLDRHPIRSGAESFLAGTASCRIEVSDVDALFAELQSAGVLHDVSRGGVDATDFGTKEFATLDTDGNLLTFFRWNDG